MTFKFLKQLNTNQKFGIGLVVFAVINLVSAIFTEIHFDEAYYWLYAQYLSWGYFDHPPFVALIIKVGQSIFENQLGLRLLTVFLSTATVYIIWLLVNKKNRNAYLFWMVIYSVLLIHPYAFITTPDAPLFFFTALFFLVYREYLKDYSIRSGILLGVVIALLLYSKYHGALVVIFVTLSNIKLLTKRSYWIAAFTSILLMLPHFWWQYSHQFPTFQYHLIDSHKTAYQVGVTLNYLASQLLLAGPWLGWLFLYALFTSKTNEAFSKGLKITGIGTFGFFFISTFGGDFEAHWTLIAFVPLIVVSVQYIGQNPQWKRWLLLSGWVNFALLIVVRIALITPIGDHIKFLGTIKGWKNDSVELRSKLGDTPVVFQDSWNRAARFAFYTNDKTVTNLNSGLYRRNQFDLYDTDEKLKGKTVYVVSNDSLQFTDHIKITTSKAIWYVKKIDHFAGFYNLRLQQVGNIKVENNSVLCNVKIDNPYANSVILKNACFEIYQKEKRRWVALDTIPLEPTEILPNGSFQKEVAINGEILQKITDEVFLTFRIGELKPIPGRIKILPLKP